MKHDHSLIESICYHEAGHCIASYVLGFKICLVNVFMTGDKPDAGIYSYPSGGFSEWDRCIDEQVLINIAGNVAECVLTGERLNWWRSADYQKTARLLAYSGVPDDRLFGRLEYDWYRAKAILDQPGCWEAVAYFADILQSIGNKYQPFSCALDGETVEKAIWMVLG